MLFREPLRAQLRARGGIFILIVTVIGITSWMQTARIVRGDVLAIKEREFVLAARSIGTPRTPHDPAPHPAQRAVADHGFGGAGARHRDHHRIALSFLGSAFPPDFPTWGKLLFDARDRIMSTHPSG
jgi:peptide/nickel transport system permease protein